MKPQADVRWHSSPISRDERWQALGLNGHTLWLTGLSGSGKSTICDEVAKLFIAHRVPYTVLDGDNVRHGLNSDLGLSDEDRAENVRRLGEVALLAADAGLVVLVAAVSPFEQDRNAVRERHRSTGLPFSEVFIDTPIEACISRDPKGLYQRFEAGEITGLTGLDAPYEPPRSPEIHLKTSSSTPSVCAQQILNCLRP